MVNSNADALGIIFPNTYDSLVPQLTNERLMASIPFAGRYRMIDFILSSMVNCGIDNIAVIVRENYHSLMDHLGAGREWDLTRKNGGLTIFPPYSQKNLKVYTGRVEALGSIIPFLKSQKEKYVILSDANIAVNFDFKAMIDAHVASGADVTIAYTKEEIPESARKSDLGGDLYFTLKLDGNRVNELYINSRESGIQNFSMNIYVIDRELLIRQTEYAFVHGYTFFERDMLAPYLDKLNVQGFCYEGYAARISNINSYFDENMKLIDDDNREALFGSNPIYTKIRDDNPTRYIGDAKAKDVLVADGCVIEGEVERSVLFRGVRIGKGAKVRDCVLMQDTVIEDGACVEYAITDKDVTVSAGKELKGADSFPVYVAKGKTV